MSISDAPPTRIDVIVIGAGVIGGAITWELSRRGHRTLKLSVHG